MSTLHVEKQCSKLYEKSNGRFPLIGILKLILRSVHRDTYTNDVIPDNIFFFSVN